MLAAMYLACVLAPGVALALGDGVAAHCALAGVHAAAALGHHKSAAPAHHDHSQHRHGATHATADDTKVLFAPETSAPDTPSHDSDKADQMCCALASLSALPAVFAAVSPPEFVASTKMSLPVQALAALTPARLYKPPIA